MRRSGPAMCGARVRSATRTPTVCLNAIVVPMLTRATLPGAMTLTTRQRISPFRSTAASGWASSASAAAYALSSAELGTLGGGRQARASEATPSVNWVAPCLIVCKVARKRTIEGRGAAGDRREQPCPHLRLQRAVRGRTRRRHRAQRLPQRAAGGVRRRLTEAHRR